MSNNSLIEALQDSFFLFGVRSYLILIIFFSIWGVKIEKKQKREQREQGEDANVES
jgi:flagellar biogenesis protein FliO